MINKGLAIAAVMLALGAPSWAKAPMQKGSPEALRVYAGAMKHTTVWLALIDQEKYGESWDAAATLFRGATTRAGWEQAVGAARAPFGKLLSRKDKTSEYKTSLPGAPDGEYLVVQFETSFEKKKHAIETVTPMKEADGAWKVAGYFIK